MVSFKDSIDDDFKSILSGDFSDRVVLNSFADPTFSIDTYGIYDESDEVVQSPDGAQVTARLPRVTLWYKDWTYEIQVKDRVRVYTSSIAYQDFVVKDIDAPSTGQILLWLKRTNEWAGG